MSKFFYAIEEVIEWWYDVWNGLFSSVISPDDAFYRSIIYTVFTLSIMGFGIDLIFSFILSFRAKKLILFNPLKIKSYFTQDNRNSVKSYYRDRYINYNRSFSVLYPTQKDNVFYKDRNVNHERFFFSLIPTQKDNVFYKDRNVNRERSFFTVSPTLKDNVFYKDRNLNVQRSFVGLRDSLFYKQNLPVMPHLFYPLRSSFYYPFNLQFFRVPEVRPTVVLMDRHFDSIHSRLYSINSEKNFHNIDSKHFNSFDSKRFRGLESYNYSIPQFRYITCLNPKFLTFLYFNRYQIMAYSNAIRARSFSSDTGIKHINGVKSEVFRAGQYLYYLNNSGRNSSRSESSVGTQSSKK